MSSSDRNDTFVICYTKPGDLWVAFSTRTRQVGVGTCPREALVNGISAADQVETPMTNRRPPQPSSASYELMLTLAKIAQPMTAGACAPGVVYRYDRTSSAATPVWP